MKKFFSILAFLRLQVGERISFTAYPLKYIFSISLITVFMTSLVVYSPSTVNSQEACPPEQPAEHCSDLILMRVIPVQASLDEDQLVDGKHMVFRLKINNTMFQPPTNCGPSGCIAPTVHVPIQFDVICSNSNVQSIIDEVTLTPGLNNMYAPRNGAINPTCKGTGASYPLCFVVIIDPFHSVLRETTDHHIKALCPTIWETKPLRILFVPFRVETETLTFDQITQVLIFGDNSHQYIDGAYPVSHREIDGLLTQTSTIPIVIPPPAQGRKFDDSDLQVIEANLAAIGRQNGWDEVVAVVKPRWFDFWNSAGRTGVGFTDIHAVIVDEREASGSAAAHEIAHSFGWVTEDFCTESVCEGDTREDNGHIPLTAPGFWVAKNCQMGTFDLKSNQCDPTGTATGTATGIPWDFMLTGDGRSDISSVWISKETFDFLLGKFILRPHLPDAAVIQAKGTIFKNGTTQLDPWYRLNGTLDIPLDNPGKLKVLYMDKNGNQIAKTGFNLNFTHLEGKELDSGSLSMNIPYVKGTDKIIIENGTQILFQRPLSSNLPKVKVISPNGGELFKAGETLKVQWEAADPDVDNKLTYTVALSQDNGNIWIPVSLELKNNQFSFKTPSNIHTNSTLIRVIASDGINTAEDISDSTFSINSVTNTTFKD